MLQMARKQNRQLANKIQVCPDNKKKLLDASEYPSLAGGAGRTVPVSSLHFLDMPINIACLLEDKTILNLVS